MKYKTVFVDTPTVKKGSWGMKLDEVKGDQLARDVEATLLEKEQQGYELHEAMPVNSSVLYAGAHPATLTSGVLLIFKLKSI